MMPKEGLRTSVTFAHRGLLPRFVGVPATE